MAKKLSDMEKQRIRALHKDGFSEREIARRIGCSRSAVWATLQKEKAVAR